MGLKLVSSMKGREESPSEGHQHMGKNCRNFLYDYALIFGIRSEYHIFGNSRFNGLEIITCEHDLFAFVFFSA